MMRALLAHDAERYRQAERLFVFRCHAFEAIWTPGPAPSRLKTDGPDPQGVKSGPGRITELKRSVTAVKFLAEHH